MLPQIKDSLIYETKLKTIFKITGSHRVGAWEVTKWQIK